MFHRSLSLRNVASTLNLPRSSFPVRPDPTLRSALIQKCTADLYAWQASARPDKDPFVLHDGPPYANGSLHIGHALNKILKDIFNRFQCSQGRRVSFVPGWDCHGLPIELKALQARAAASKKTSPEDALAVRKAAAALASKTIREQMDTFKSWAVMGDWDHAYSTMSPEFESRQLQVFAELVRKGLIFRQHKPVYWSPSTGSALAEAELEYDDGHVSDAAYIKFEIEQLPTQLQHLGNSKVFALIWTTTPWTLPANAAIAFHSDIDYVALRRKNETLLVASSRAQDVIAAACAEDEGIHGISEPMKGSDLAGCLYRNPLKALDAAPQPLIHADFVSADSGSGLVHVAPGHGHDDFSACLALGIPAFAPLDNHGCFTDAAYPQDPQRLRGKAVLSEGTRAVLDIMTQHELVWATHKYRHRYPIDWRTKLPVIIRATAQWFANIDRIKDDALSALEDVAFMPETGRARLTSFVSGRGDWCISRQRAWGVPIPALYRFDGSDEPEAIMTYESVEHINKVIQDRGTNAWWTDSPDDSAWIAPSLPSGKYVRGKDTMDVWFDSGSTWMQLAGATDSKPPADVYLEGTDQHRGWFQSSLLTRVAYLSSIGAPATAPFKRLLTHGFTLDQKGRKMSKSIGNVVGPDEISNGTLLPPLKPKGRGKQKAKQPTNDVKYDALGPDALRLWAASNDYTQDVLVGEPVLQSINNTLHKYRVTIKWLLGVLEDYSPQQSQQSLEVTDQLAYLHLGHVTQAVHSSYEAYEPYKAMRALDRYVVQDLSSFYFEYAKDLLYTGPAQERRRVQAVCFDILHHLLAMMSPVLPLLAAETMHYASPGLKQLLETEHHDPFRRTWLPAEVEADAMTQPLSLEHRAQVVSAIRSSVRELQERLRNDDKIGSGLECQVHVAFDASAVPQDLSDFLSSTSPSEMANALVVSDFSILSDFQSSGEAASDSAVKDIYLGANAPRSLETFATSVVEEHGLRWIAAHQIKANLKNGEPFELAVLVGPVTDKSKCQRCWRFAVEKKKSSEESAELCPRCVTATGQVTK